MLHLKQSGSNNQLKQNSWLQSQQVSSRGRSTPYSPLPGPYPMWAALLELRAHVHTPCSAPDEPTEVFIEKLWAKLNRFHKTEPKRENPLGTDTGIASKNVSGLILHSSHCAPDFHFFPIKSSNLLNADCRQQRREVAPATSPIPACGLCSAPSMGTGLSMGLSPWRKQHGIAKAQTVGQSASCKGPAPLSPTGKSVMD